jgi:hypothetical protein
MLDAQIGCAGCVSDRMHADKACPNSDRTQAGATDLSNVYRGLFTPGYRGRVRNFTEHFAARKRRTILFAVIFLCDGCLLLLNTTSMQGRQNSGSYSGVAEGSSLRFVTSCGWARDSRRFEGTTIFRNVPHSVTSQETWRCHDEINVSAGAVSSGLLSFTPWCSCHSLY